MSKPNNSQLADIVSYMAESMTVPQVVSHYDKSMIYTTDEKMVGQWVDNKPLYKKTITNVTMPQVTTNGTKAEALTDVGVTNIDKVVKIDTIFLAQNYRFGNYVLPGNDSYKVQLDLRPPQQGSYNYWAIKISSETTSGNGWTPVVTIYYTKTTDTALSYTIGDENDYSTDERLIGTWIDGSKVFQKTIVDTMPSAVNTTKDIAIGTSVDMAFLVNAFTKASNGAIQPIPLIIPASLETGHGIVITSNSFSGSPNKIRVGTSMSSMLNMPLYVTIQYTKTS